MLQDRAREGRVECGVREGQLIDVRHLKRDVREPAGAGELAPMRQGLHAEVNTDGFAWRHRLGEVNGDRAGPAPAVDEAHPGSQMQEEKRGPCRGAAGKHGTAPGVVYLVRPLGTRLWIRHVPLLRGVDYSTEVIARDRTRSTR